MHILLHALVLFYVSLYWRELSALQIRISEENTINAMTQQFITPKYQAAS